MQKEKLKTILKVAGTAAALTLFVALVVPGSKVYADEDLNVSGPNPSSGSEQIGNWSAIFGNSTGGSGSGSSSSSSSSSSTGSSASNVAAAAEEEVPMAPALSAEEVRLMREEEAKEAARLVSIHRSTLSNGLRTTIDGFYMAESVDGVAVVTPRAEVAEQLGLAKGEIAWMVTWDITEKNASAAAQSLSAIAQAQGGEVIAMLRVNLNKLSAGKLINLDADAGTLSTAFGIPRAARADNAQFAVLRVVSGGQYEVLSDTDESPSTVTVNLPAGDAAYALIRLAE